VIPGVALGPPLDVHLKENVVKLSRPDKDHVINVNIVETTPGASVDGPKFEGIGPTRVLASWTMPNGNTLWVTAHVSELGKFNAENLQRNEVLVKRLIDPAIIKRDKTGAPSVLRMLVVLSADDGVGKVLDLCAEFLRADEPNALCQAGAVD
jgi:hypothetical protein